MSENKNHLWHNLETQEIGEILDSDLRQGLSQKEVVLRQKFGRNEIVHEEKFRGLKIFLSQFKSPLIYILLIAGVITLLLKEWADSIVIFLAVFVNIIVGYFQEFKASRILKALQKVIKVKAVVIREGKLKEIFQEELVAGDIMVLRAGDKIPADGRIISSFNLKVQESALTGEWLAAEKNRDVLPSNTPLPDRDNMVYLGTMVQEGLAKTIVTEIGSQTEIGKVARLIRTTHEEKTPYQKKLAEFSKVLGLVIAAVCLFVFLRGVLSGKDLKEMFLVSVAVAVAAIPEGLAISLTVILALGMQNILTKQGLVRKLSSAETLGLTSIIATDKTLTLTEGKMELAEVRSENPKLALEIGVLTSQAFIEGDTKDLSSAKIKGQPTDVALLRAGLTMGLAKADLEKKFPKIYEIPFRSQDKFTAVLRKTAGSNTLFVLGAPEKIIGLSSQLALKKGKTRLRNKELTLLTNDLRDLTGKGLRVLAVAYKKTNKNTVASESNQSPKGLIFAGFLAFQDPLRKDVKESIILCQQAGIKPIIVTGDHLLTAKAVAQELGLAAERENVMEAGDLDKLSDEELQKVLAKINVFARVEPRHKSRIIEAWQANNQVVAMTGDGINDAPALKKADIGVALGSGTDVAKEASDLVLLNDSFSIIVAAVEEGRAILDNIRKVITYLLSGSFTEMILVMAAVVLGIPLPISALQILWVNLIEDGLPNIALAFEPKEKGLLKRKPDNSKAPLLTKEMKVIIFAVGFFTDIVLLGLFFWLYNKYGASHLHYIRTMVFAGLTIDSLFYVFSCKTLRKNIWQTNIFSNKILLAAWLVGLVALLLAIYLPWCQVILKTESLVFNDWWILFGLGFLKLFLIELTKYYFNKRSA